MWSHDRAPIMTAGILSETGTIAANKSVDAAILGGDAEQVGRQLGRQWNPRFVYDIPRAHAKELSKRVKQIAKSHSLDARLEILRKRVPHRTRAEHALAIGKGAGEVQFHGIWAAVVGEVPRGELRVVGELMPEGSPDAKRLRRISIAVREGVTARSEQFGCAMVDWARLMIVDLDAIDLWEHEQSLDGLADFAFWGADAAELAKRFDAVELEADVFGWRDVPIEEAASRGFRVTELRGGKLKFATAFRPHSHHYQLMQQVRASSTESGVVTLGDARTCGFMTTWGDGLFEVHRDLDANGRLLRLRIELGTELRQKLLRRLELRSWTSALVSRQIVDEGKPIRFMYREATARDEDSGWRILSGLETDAYNDDTENIAIVPLNQIARLDKRVDKLLDEAVGSVFERASANDNFERVTDWTPRR
ncbi:MAG: hypothetical protein JWO36_430 [Myxococcales bacterium]|nr:hypothetical protein [Myxococcales bacterium]